MACREFDKKGLRALNLARPQCDPVCFRGTFLNTWSQRCASQSEDSPRIGRMLGGARRRLHMAWSHLTRPNWPIQQSTAQRWKAGLARGR